MKQYNRELKTIPIARIRPMPNQPRIWFEPAEIDALAASIRQTGVNNDPVLVSVIRGDPEHDYEIIGGERRYQAILQLGGEEILAMIIDEPDEEERRDLAALDNIGHEPLSTYEQAVMLRRHQERHPTRSQREIGDRFGKNQGWVSVHLAIAGLESDILELMHPKIPEAQRLPMVLAIELARMRTATLRRVIVARWKAKMAEGGATVSGMKHVINQVRKDAGEKLRRRKSSHEFRRVQVMLREFMGRCDLFLELESGEVATMIARQPPGTKGALLAAFDVVASKLEQARKKVRDCDEEAALPSAPSGE